VVREFQILLAVQKAGNWERFLEGANQGLEVIHARKGVAPDAIIGMNTLLLPESRVAFQARGISMPVPHVRSALHR